tara:strand:+ start:32 stop:907 length:876 start_codon:yes stop_codon:yes gene_type:complete
MKNKVILFLLFIFLNSCSETTFLINSAKKVTNKITTMAQDPKYKIGKPYKINGQWFYPAVNYNYDEIGIASWYGPNFHGKKTANGEIFDQDKISAAHKTLPLPSIVEVTNLENNKTLKLRVNDRGPFVRGRIIDLSKQAAKELGVLINGTAKVRVEVVEHESRILAQDFDEYEGYVSNLSPPEKIIKTEIISDSANKKEDNYVELNNKDLESRILDKENILIQVGAFNDIRNANMLKKKLSNFKAFIKREFIDKKFFYRVRIGPYKNISFVNSIIEQLKSKGFTNTKIVMN